MGRTGIGLLWLCLCCAIPSSFCQFVNVANGTGKTYNQSSYFNATSHPASFAANGKTSGNFTSPNCIHTANNDTTPWWQVDLGRKYPVYNITLWARTYFRDRLYPLNITVDGQLCVRATSNNNRRQSLTCISAIYGQVVRLTRDYRASGNYIALNLCEVKIWVCPDGKYGYQCDSLCSSLTQCSQCYRNGTCAACSGHFKPPQCTGCDVGYYKSSSSCVQCEFTCVNRMCNAWSGRCDNCASGSYKSGTMCVPCNSNCVNGQCYSKNGRCTTGCNAGWYGDRCDSRCSTKTPGCSQCVQDGGQCTVCQTEFYKSGSTCVQCSSNCKNRPCDRVSGRCTDGCNAGWYGDRCDSRCSTKTPGCSQCVQNGGQCTVCQTEFYKSGSTCVQCSSNCKNRQCDRVSGRCTDGCNAGWYGDRCDSRCSTKTPGCSQCVQDGGQCTVCQTEFYKSGSTCVQCSSNCKNRPCDRVSGRCTDGCTEGYYGDQCSLMCSSRTVRCTQCTRDGQCTACSGHFQPWPCTACKDRYYKSGTTCVPCSSNCLNRQCDPDTGVCDRPLEEEKESLVGPLVGAVVGSIVGVGLIAVIVTAVLCWRRKSNGSSGKTPAVEMSSAAPANKLSDSAIARPDPPLPSSSPADVTDGIYEIPEDDKDRNSGPTRQAAPPTSLSSAESEGRDYENEIQENNYDKLCVYSNDEGDRELYMELADVTVNT